MRLVIQRVSKARCHIDGSVFSEIGKGLMVLVGVGYDDSAEDIEAYFRAKGLKLPYSAQNDRRVYEMFAQTRIPRIYICEKGGIIRYIFTDDPVPSYDQLKSSLEEVIH
jgi:hypothetical protein